MCDILFSARLVGESPRGVKRGNRVVGFTFL